MQDTSPGLLAAGWLVNLRNRIGGARVNLPLFRNQNLRGVQR
jgi:hypothetical protein